MSFNDPASMTLTELLYQLAKKKLVVRGDESGTFWVIPNVNLANFDAFIEIDDSNRVIPLIRHKGKRR
jgi:hypothetical protein